MKAIMALPKRIFTKDHMFTFLRGSVPFLILLIVSCLPFSVFFKSSGITGGDDIIWHLVYIYDYTYGLENGFNGIGPNHLLLGTVAHNTYLFYASAPHLIVAYLYEGFKGVGATITGTMKFVAVLSVYLSGIFTYLLVMKMTKGNKFIALIVGIAYIFQPYRLWNFFYRMAYNEGFAEGFIPLLWLGIYGVMHDKKYKVSNYLCIIFGSSLLILSHPFTALVAGLGAGIIILVNALQFKRIFTDKFHLISIFASICLIFGLVAWYLLPMYKARSTGYYNLTNEVTMWTNVEHLIADLSKTGKFSGFINFDWLKTWPKTLYGDSTSSWAIDLFVFPFFSSIGMALLIFFHKKNKTAIGICAGLISVLAILLFSRREEVIMAMFAMILGMGAFVFFEKPAEPDLFNKKDVVSIFKNPELYAVIFMLVLDLFWLYNEAIWKITPAVFRQAQFPFRFWGIFGFIALFALVLICKPFYKSQWFKGAALVSTCFLMCIAMGPADKRIALHNGGVFYYDNKLYSYATSRSKIGVMNEYVPQVFNDSKYRSEYTNSLYYHVRRQVKGQTKWTYTLEEYKAPVFLEGTGTSSVTALDTPNAAYDITITSETALIQVPQFYYDGYQVDFISKNSADPSYSVKPIYMDGLLAFSGKKGNYNVYLHYVGMKTYRASVPLFFISLAGCVALGIVGYVVPKVIKAKKDSDLYDKEANN